MENSKAEALQPRVLLVWQNAVDYLTFPVFSNKQVTLCPGWAAKGCGFNFYSIPQGLVECPLGDYDLYEFVHRSNQIEDKEFDLVVVNSSIFDSCKPFNTKKFGCPTVLLAGDTHWGFPLYGHRIAPINYLLNYCSQENFDYVVTTYNRQHLHWFVSAGIQNAAWLPLMNMYVVTHEWVETRENRIAFFGHIGSFHPRRSFLINALREAGLPLIAKSGTREEGAHLFAHSLISFNCSLNGDINLRNLEIISAGGFLLTDRLSFASGFDEYLVPGLYCDTYNSYSELVEKIKFYLENPESAIEIAKRAYEKFFTDWHPKYRMADLMNWIFNGELPDFYAAKSDPRFLISTSSRDLINTRLAIYESAQELHRLQEQPKVLVGRNCPPVIVADLLDLQRLDLYVEPGFPLSDLPSDGKILSRLHVANINSYVKEKWDLLIVKTDDQLTKFGFVFSSRFVFILGSENQIAFSNTKDLFT